MRKLEYTVRFNTPAFLGNAGQSGQWRTPPFKALLRQWWRVAYAASNGFQADVAGMRREEGLLFGNAWLENEFRKSAVRIRLDCWDAGKLKTWQALPTVRHPEVNFAVGSDLYLGYGPLTFQNHQLRLKANAAIQFGESAKFSLAVPDGQVDAIKAALALMDAYGTLGGRSRNGWGSFSLAPADADSALGADLAGFTRPWLDALALDWPHAIGCDQEHKPLIWQTAKPYDDWKSLMRDLAIIKVGLRTQFLFALDTKAGDSPIMKRGEQVGINHGHPQERHWLSYPTTNHPVKPNQKAKTWLTSARLPNSLRFKVRPDAADPNKLRGVVFHVPCLPPREFAPNPAAIQAVWRQVHGLLDHLTNPSSSRDYSMIADTTRRNALKQQLDNATLQRIGS